MQKENFQNTSFYSATALQIVNLSMVYAVPSHFIYFFSYMLSLSVAGSCRSALAAACTALFHLKDVVLEGGFAFEKAHGMSIYKYNEKDPIFGEAFNFAMSRCSILVVKQILKKFMGFEGLSTFVDVGGGIGGTLNLIISKYPSIKGINFDMPEVLRNAPSLNGIEHVGGDMFKEVPKGDAMLLKLVLHNWNDEQCLKILKNCYKALPKTGKVIIIEAVLPVAPESTNFCKVATQLDNLISLELERREQSLSSGPWQLQLDFQTSELHAVFVPIRSWSSTNNNNKVPLTCRRLSWST
ncbi:caffeic acid 3-O-methyltransferase-like [Carya illinoinensis]|uniref:caffeic acid 3-O-methyltransferase-like n=1 Tax=Carya illinoinensis TaxID=32201 RepID=UPI001C72234A|nr:caffeic acid 3-O-methyltransferase-like [Carya illinoinensis]